MICYESYVKFSIEGLLAALEDELSGASPTRRLAIEQERSGLLADYYHFIDIAAGLPRFDAALFDRVFPRRDRNGDLCLRVKPHDAGETIKFFEILDAFPLAHREGDRAATPWTAESGTHRIFPYTILVQLKPILICRFVWCHEFRQGRFVFVRLHLPDELLVRAVDQDLGVLKDEMFVEGLSPYVYAQTTQHGRRVGLHFPKAYTPTADGRFRLLSWRDIPLLSVAEKSQNAINQAPAQTDRSVTPCAKERGAQCTSHG